MDICIFCSSFFYPDEDYEFDSLIDESVENLGFNLVAIDKESNLVSEFYFSGNQPFISSKRKINYCPMCGKRLVKGE